MSVTPTLSAPLELQKLFTSGVVRFITARMTGVWVDLSPARGRRWMIIGGAVTHNGATTCVVQHVNVVDVTVVDVLYNTTSTSAVTNSLFSTTADSQQANYTPKIVIDETRLRFYGASGDVIALQVIEW